MECVVRNWFPGVKTHLGNPYELKDPGAVSLEFGVYRTGTRMDE